MHQGLLTKEFGPMKRVFAPSQAAKTYRAWSNSTRMDLFTDSLMGSSSNDLVMTAAPVIQTVAGAVGAYGTASGT